MPVHWACSGGHANIVDYIYQHFPNLEVDVKDDVRPINFPITVYYASLIRILEVDSLVFDNTFILASNLSVVNG